MGHLRLFPGLWRDHHGIIGGLNFFGPVGVGQSPNPDYAATIPHQAFMIFQAMFAVITPALISGAFAERFKFSTFLVFILLWATFIYDPIAHWVWGTGGWLRQPWASWISPAEPWCIFPRAWRPWSRPLPWANAAIISIRVFLPHNMTMVLIGTALLWFGWFGFNAGSALAANGVAISAFIATNFAGAAAMIVWMLLEWIIRGKPTALGAASGAIAGLAAVTPASGFISPRAAIVIGAVASPLCFYAIQLKNKFLYDDTLDAFGVHGIGGIWGTLATGLFANLAVNPAGANGWLHGNPKQLLIQGIAVLATGLYALVGTWIIIKVLDLTMGIRVHDHEETIGLDLTQHGEAGYHM